MRNIKDITYIILIFLTPIIQIILNWSAEVSMTTKIFGYSIFYTEIIYFFVILYRYSTSFKINIKSVLIIFGFLISLLSNIGNYGYYDDRNWFVLSLCSSDFYFYGFLFCVLSFSKSQLSKIKYILLLLFTFICLQNILVALGFIQVQGGMMFGIVNRYGTTAGSCIQTGFLIFILMGSLLLFKFNKFIIYGIFIAGIFSISLTLSRGPILSVMISCFGYLFYKFKQNKRAVVLIFAFALLLSLTENKYHIYSNLQEKNASGDITSGREERWAATLAIYKKSSFLLGSGSGITPNERIAKSDNMRNSVISCSPHNIYLSYLVENGLFGLANFMLLLFVLYRSIRKRRISFSYSLLSFYTLPLVLMNTEIILRNSLLAFFFWLYYYLLYNLKSYKNENITSYS